MEVIITDERGASGEELWSVIQLQFGVVLRLCGMKAPRAGGEVERICKSGT